MIQSRKLFIRSLCVILVLLMAVLDPVRLAAAGENPLAGLTLEQTEAYIAAGQLQGVVGAGVPLYVCDLMIGTGETEAEVRKKLHDKGYLVYEQNMNEGADGYDHEYCSYLGYKLTTDRSKAITNINVMDQQGGYSTFNYKDYVSKLMPGAAATAASMQAACKEMKKNYEAGKKGALIAKEYLDVFCVPQSSAVFTGTPLGDYLLDPARTQEDYKELLLLLNASILAVINNMLMLGCVDSTLLPTVIGDTGIASATGVCGYSEMKENSGWLAGAIGQVATTYKNEIGAETRRELIDTYSGQVYLIHKALDGGFTPAAVDYLKSVKVGYIYDTSAKKLVSRADASAYDFLSTADDGSMAAFCRALPEICAGGYFTDVLEICAHDESHRLPGVLDFDIRIESDWLGNAVKMIDNMTFDPYAGTSKASHSAEVARYNEDIQRLLSSLDRYFADYDEAKKEYDKNGSALIGGTSDETSEEAEQQFLDEMQGKAEAENPDSIYYISSFRLLQSYAVKSGSGDNLGEYLRKAVTLYRARSDKNENEWVATALIYPVVRALTDGQKYAVKTSAFLSVLLNTAACETEIAAMRGRLEGTRADLLADMKGYDHVSVWYGTNKELFETKNIGITSKEAESAMEEKILENAVSNEMQLTDRCFKALNVMAYAAAVAAGVVLVAFVAGSTVAFGSTGIIASIVLGFKIGFYGFCGVTAFGTVATALCMIGVIAIAAILVLIVAALICTIIMVIASLKKEKPSYTTVPDVMFDSFTVDPDAFNDTGDGGEKKEYETRIVRYDVVPDTTGRAGDINCYDGLKWTALYYTTDPSYGSPMTMGPSGKFFGSRTGLARRDDKSMPLCKFDMIDLFNLNTNCYDDDVDGIYLWYYTEDSLKGITHSNPSGKYVKSVMIAAAKDSTTARSYLLSKEDYYLLDVDLAPSNEEYCVYLGYSTTNVEKNALRDIVGVIASVADKIAFGEATYNNVLPDGMRNTKLKTCEIAVSAREETPFPYTLFTTSKLGSGKDAAPPILAGSFFTVSDVNAQIPAGAEPIRMMAGGLFDFNSWNGQEPDNGFDTHMFVYYQTERPITSETYGGEQYIGGIAFFSGSMQGIDRDDTSEYDLTRYAESLGYHLVKFDLSEGLLDGESDVTYMAYYLTYNPYRAITDLGVFTGEPKYGYLPEAIATADVGYGNCATYTQAVSGYYGSGGEQRLIRTSHGYYTAIEDEGEHDGCDDIVLCTRGMYAAGYRTGVWPLGINNIAISLREGAIPKAYSGNRDIYLMKNYNNGTKQMVSLGAGWKSVHPLDQYFYDSYSEKGELLTDYNIAYGEAYDDSSRHTRVFNLFVQNASIPDRIRGNYVSGAQLVSSNNEYCSFDLARLAAMQMGQEIVNLDAPMRMYSPNAPDLLRASPVYCDYDAEICQDYGNGCIFLVVSYTDAESMGLGDIRVIEQREGVETEGSLILPLDETVSTAYTKTNLAVITAEGEEDDSPGLGGILSGLTSEEAKDVHAGIALYTTLDGPKINRLVVQQTPVSGLDNGNYKWHENTDGVAEYYLRAGDGFEPYSMIGYGSSVRSYICARRFDVREQDANYQYVSDITVIRASCADGTLREGAAGLGALGYPFFVDYNPLDATIGSYGSTEVALIGIKRTGDVKKSIKDIKVADDDYGLYYMFNDLTYIRANSEPLHFGGNETENAYLYYTCETGGNAIYTGEKITWEELIGNPNTDWESVDWRMVDLSTLDSRFSSSMHVIGDAAWASYNAAKADEVKDGIPAAAFSVTNFGLVAGDGKTYWAGGKGSAAPVLSPIPTNAVRHEIVCFDGRIPAIKLVYLNQGNGVFEQAIGEYYASLDRAASGDSAASVFADASEILPIAVVGMGSAALIAAAVWLSRKKRKKSD